MTHLNSYTVYKKTYTDTKHTHTYRVGQKSGATDTWPKFLSHMNQLKKIFTGRLIGKFVVKWILKIPTHLVYVATLPCETLVSAKQVINYKLQGSVATYLRCSGVVNNQIR